MQRKPNHPGIRVRHSRSCASHSAARCNCSPSYEAWVSDRRTRTKIRKTFPTLAAAKGWRADATFALRRGTLRAPSPVTLREAADAWLEGAKDGSIRTRSGDPFKPSAIRSYEQALNVRVLKEFGAVKLSELGRNDLQDFADDLLAKGLDPSTIRNMLMPLRAIYRRAVARGEVAVNPTTGLSLPAVRGKRDKVASPEQAAKLLAALGDDDRALWATAFYAGLRCGELMALRWSDIDFAEGIIRVERAFDPKDRRFIEPKSRSGKRRVPIASVLRLHLLERKARCAWSSKPDGLVFARCAHTPLDYDAAMGRARRAWEKARLEPIRLHEARHTFASLMIAAGINAKALSTYMGHSSVTITFDRYGHLMPGNESEAAELLDSYLAGTAK
jgi:integrase